MTTTTQAYSKTAAQVIKIIQQSPAALRQYQIAGKLNFPEHNDWSTHSVLNRMIDERLIYAEYHSTVNVDGSLSKRKYRFFFVLQPVRVRKRDKVMTFIGSFLSATFPKLAY